MLQRLLRFTERQGHAQVGQLVRFAKRIVGCPRQRQSSLEGVDRLLIFSQSDVHVAHRVEGVAFLRFVPNRLPERKGALEFDGGLLEGFF